MNLEELAATLPNGFHDAELRTFEMNYVSRTLTCDLDIWIGDIEMEAARELYRAARLVLGGVAYLVIEPPDERQSWLRAGAVTIDAGIGEPVQGKWECPVQPPGAFRGYFYVGELNAFMRFAADEASLEWRGQAENRGTKA